MSRVITLGDYAGHVFLGLSFEPDCVAVREKIVVGFFFGDDAAADGNDGAIACAKDALESALLDGAIAGLAVEGENFRERHAPIPFYFLAPLHLGDCTACRRIGGCGRLLPSA